MGHDAAGLASGRSWCSWFGILWSPGSHRHCEDLTLHGNPVSIRPCLYMTSSTQVAPPDPGQAGKDVHFPQQEQEELLSVLRLLACLCCVERVLHLCSQRALPCHCPGSQPVAADLFGEQVNVLARELEGVTTLPLGVHRRLFPHTHVVLQSVRDAPKWRNWDLHLHQLRRDSPRTEWP